MDVIIHFDEYEKLKLSSEFLNSYIDGSALRVREYDYDGWARHSLVILNPDETINRMSSLIKNLQTENVMLSSENYDLKHDKRTLWQRIINKRIK